ncbi:MAG: glycine betaine ABC transporter substrate-binding protein [Paracoccaceae bacterium]
MTPTREAAVLRQALALAAATATASVLALGSAMAAEPENRPVVRLGQVGLSFYAVTGGVVQELLEREGYTVETTVGSHAEIFPQLGEGEVDILAATWLPGGHASLYAPVEDVTFRIAPLYEDARFFWVVPGYVPEDAVASIADLAEPDVRERMPDTIVSLPEATGLTTGGRRVMDAYDLDEAGYELVAAPPADWLGAFREAVEAEEWVVFPLWQPQWVNAAFDVRALAEPEGAYGPPDTAWLLGHEGLRDKLDAETLEKLAALRLPVAAVTEMDRLVNVEGMTPREAARAWLADNPDVLGERNG